MRPAFLQGRNMRFRNDLRRVIVILLCLASLLPSNLVNAQGPLKKMIFGRTPIQELAHRIDLLEKHVEQYGSVVAKTPDIWGEERLTLHRFEYEQQMFGELKSFRGTINAQISRSDQAFLASALAVSSALNSTGTQPSNRAVALLSSSTTSTTFLPADGIVRPTSSPSTPFASVTTDPKTSDGKSVALEPTLFLEQMSRYLYHLHELRRINEGDDIKDLPGYTLHMLRLPVSVMPGKKTRQGFGAEITITTTPQLGDELLPLTFKDWVINDLVYQNGLAIFDLLNSDKLCRKITFKQPNGREASVRPRVELLKAILATIGTPDHEDLDRPKYFYSLAENGWWELPPPCDANGLPYDANGLPCDANGKQKRFFVKLWEIILSATWVQDALTVEFGRLGYCDILDTLRTIDLNELLKIQNIYKTLSTPNILKLLSIKGVENAINRPNIDEILSLPSIDKLISLPDVDELLKVSYVNDIIKTPEAKKIALFHAVESTFENPEFKTLNQSPVLKKLFKDSSIVKTIVDVDLKYFLMHPSITNIFKTPDAKVIYEEPKKVSSKDEPQELRVKEMLSNQNVQDALKLSSIVSLLKNLNTYYVDTKNVNMEILGNNDWANVFKKMIVRIYEVNEDWKGSYEVLKVLSKIDPAQLESLKAIDFAELLKVPEFKELIERKDVIELIKNSEIKKLIASPAVRKLLKKPEDLRKVFESDLGMVFRPFISSLNFDSRDVKSNGFRNTLWEGVESTYIKLSSNGSRNAQMSFPLSQFSTTYGQGMLLCVGLDAFHRIGRDLETDLVQYQDIEGYLKEEISAAYELLQRPENRFLWDIASTELVTAIRRRDRKAVERIRVEFFNQLEHTLNMPQHDGGEAPTGCFAWAIVVNAVLLNERLNEDIRAVASSKGCACLPSNWEQYHLPEPSAEARMTFNQYVQCRWPIHTFHVDPMTQDQNVGDKFSTTRELQLAMAVAVSTGKISVDQATKFARRIQLDLETVALNRTCIGFSHGEETFGWRFYPRVQSPPIESNATVIFRDLLKGGPSNDALLKLRQIEPGPRECVALVVAPAFLRQLNLDVNGDWQALTNSARGKPTTEKGVEMGREVQCIRELAQACQCDAHLYRDGELHRLLLRAKQLEQTLPLQTIHAEVPVTNDLGGFRLLVPSGNINKSPVLLGWTGRPGYVRGREATFFLMGENFKLQGTRVIAGNKSLFPNQTAGQSGNSSAATEKGSSEANPPAAENKPAKTTTPAVAVIVNEPAVRLISDRILEVTLPSDCQTFKKLRPDGVEAAFVSVQVATYFGESQKLHIPLAEDTIEKSSEKAATDATKAAKDSISAAKDAIKAATDSSKAAADSHKAATNSTNAAADAQKAAMHSSNSATDANKAAMESTKAATEAAKTAVTRHENQFHVNRYDWKISKMTGIVEYDAADQVHDLKADKGITVTESDQLNPFHPTRASLRCFVYQITKGADGKEERKQLICPGPPKRPCSTEGVLLNFNDSAEADADNVVRKILDVIKPHITKSDKTIALEIEGFLQFANDNLPVIKLDQPLRLDLQEKKETSTDRAGSTKSPKMDRTFSSPFDDSNSSNSESTTASESEIRFVLPWRPTSHSSENRRLKEGIAVKTR
jgi:hypothetical protein